MKVEKLDIYKDLIDEALDDVEKYLNHYKKIRTYKHIPGEVLDEDTQRTKLELEVSLATYCILLRKMFENHLLTYTDDERKDINSIIHSNRFEYDEELYVYSRRGKEKVDLNNLLNIGKQLID